MCVNIKSINITSVLFIEIGFKQGMEVWDQIVVVWQKRIEDDTKTRNNTLLHVRPPMVALVSHISMLWFQSFVAKFVLGNELFSYSFLYINYV